MIVILTSRLHRSLRAGLDALLYVLISFYFCLFLFPHFRPLLLCLPHMGSRVRYWTLGFCSTAFSVLTTGQQIPVKCYSCISVLPPVPVCWRSSVLLVSIRLVLASQFGYFLFLDFLLTLPSFCQTRPSLSFFHLPSSLWVLCQTMEILFPLFLRDMQCHGKGEVPSVWMSS